jgi:hypothetical protein
VPPRGTDALRNKPSILTKTAHDARLSPAIGIARVLCILGIVYAHAWTGLAGPDLARMNDTAQGLLRWALIDLLGRSAVPLLSIVSGWLVATSVAKSGLRAFFAAKARAVLLPMVMWNALALALVSGAAWVGWIQAPLPTTLWWTIDELLCLATPNDINVQMSFLRDLFICMLAAPLLMRLRGWALGMIAAATLIWAVSGFAFVLLLRPSILLFFVLGIAVRRYDLAVIAASRPMLFIAGGYTLMAIIQIWLETVGTDRGVDHPVLLASIDLLTRFVTAWFFWSIAWRLTGSRAAAALLQIEPFAFMMFCSHLIMMWLAGPLIGRLIGPLGAPLYPAFLLAQPFLALAATLILGASLKDAMSSVAALLSGGRLSPGNRAPHPRAIIAPAQGSPDPHSSSSPSEPR